MSSVESSVKANPSPRPCDPKLPTELDVAWAREQFPSLQLRVGAHEVAYFDNPAGTQVPGRVVRALSDYFDHANANVHGPFLTSQRTDALVDRARLLCAAFLGATAREEIVFGPNMTSLTLAFSQAIGRTLRPGDEIIVSDLDHDANISPWLDLEEQGVVVRRIPIRVEQGCLDLEAFERLLNGRTRLVAVGYASNALGTINDVRGIAERARSVGARVWVDAVHFAPHGPIDVRALGADYLVCSAYKFFGPHVGVLWARRERLDALPARRIRPAPDTAPDKFEPGTKNHEGLAGLVGALEYLAALGGGLEHDGEEDGVASARQPLLRAMTSIAAYETKLSRQLVSGLSAIRGLRLYGVTDPGGAAARVPTFGFTLRGVDNRELGRRLGERGLFVWAGHHYALTLMDRLGLGEAGVVRVGAVHYNTAAEVERLLAALDDLAR